MPKRKGRKPQVGDVFTIPTSDGRVGFGQVLAKFEEEMLLMAIFSIECEKDHVPALDRIVNSDPLFIANSMDAKIWHGDWVIIGNQQPGLPLPKYKVQIGETMHVESYDGKQHRPATESDLQVLTFRGCFSPIVLEDALKDHLGLPFGDFDTAQLARLRAAFESAKAQWALQAARVSQ